MITANEKMLIIEMTTLRMSLAAKARVQNEMHPTERNKIYMAVEALQELEEYYTAKEQKGGIES
jgi:hypothetical protein